MKKGSALRMSAATTFALLLISYALDAAVVRADSPEQFRMVRGYLIVVPVMLNGAGPFDFMLDTGANTTLIDTGLAAEFASQAVERVSLSTAAGSQLLPRARIRSLQLAGKTVADLEVLPADLRPLRSVDARIRGVVGWNFLSEFDFLLDIRGRRIELRAEEERAGVPAGRQFPLVTDEGKPLVGARFSTRGGAPLRLVVDSGIERLAIFGGVAESLCRADELLRSRWVAISTFAGSRNVRSSLVEALRVGDETFRHLPALLMSDEARAEDGLLPVTLFRSIYFDRDGFVIFNPQARD